MQPSMDERALLARSDPQQREIFIQENEKTILQMASKAAGHYVTVSDDEWSVALYAFSRAIDAYDSTKGSFMTLAATVIRRDLIDEYRRNARYAPEMLTAPDVMEGNAEPEEDKDHVLQAVARESMLRDNAAEGEHSLKEEIAEAGEELQGFGVSFMELTECAPKQERTRAACRIVTDWVLSQPELVQKVRRNRQLPAAEIRKGIGATEKLLEKYRKFLIAVIVIGSGDYPYLKRYLKAPGGGEQEQKNQITGSQRIESQRTEIHGKEGE